MKYVRKSSEESREAKTLSVLAVVETLFFVCLTWFIAWFFDSFIHIYTLVAIAPLLLLKTPESIEQGNNWFLHEIKSSEDTWYKNKIFWLYAIFSSIISFFMVYVFSITWLADLSGWQLFSTGLLIGYLAIVAGVAVAGIVGAGVGSGVGVGIVAGGAVAGIVGSGAGVGVGIAGVGVVGVIVGAEGAEAEAVVAVAAAAGVAVPIALGFLLRSVFIKCLVTIKHTIQHPLYALSYLPKNYAEQLWVNDSCYSPELLPEIHKQNNFFQLSGLLKRLNELDIKKKIFLSLIIPIWFLGYFYRWSIKSSAWFWFPLAYVANVEALFDRKKQKVANAFLTRGIIITIQGLLISGLAYYYFGKGQEIVGVHWSQVLFAEALVHVKGIWLLSAAAILGLILSIFYLVANNSAQKNVPFSEWDYTALYCFARGHSVLWIVFLGYNAVTLFNQHALDTWLDWLK